MLSSLGLFTHDSWGASRCPGKAEVSIDRSPVTHFGEWAVSTGFSGVGKSISSSSSNGSSVLVVGEAATTGKLPVGSCFY